MTNPHQNWQAEVAAAMKQPSAADSWRTTKLRDLTAIAGPGKATLAYALAQTTISNSQAGDLFLVMSSMNAPAAPIPVSPPSKGYGNHESAVAAARQVGARLRGEQAKAGAKVEVPVSGPVAAARSLRGTFTRTSRMA